MKEMNCGFEIIMTKKSDRGGDIVLGRKESDWEHIEFEYVVWRRFEMENGKFEYNSGDYSFDQESGLKDFQDRK